MIWNEDDIKILKECAENGVPWSQCAKMLKRKLPTVRAKAYNMGFVKYNGMTAEQFVWAWIKSEFLMPKKLMFNPDNLYYETLKTTIQNHEKGICPVAKKSKKAKRSKEVKNAENS